MLDGQVRRGCMSDDSNMPSICRQNPNNCITCEGKGCNKQMWNYAPQNLPSIICIVTTIIMFVLSIA